jgi:hypothetical protein
MGPSNSLAISFSRYGDLIVNVAYPVEALRDAELDQLEDLTAAERHIAAISDLWGDDPLLDDGGDKFAGSAVHEAADQP